MKEATNSRAVLVLGPHRSGTSAVARVLNLLGVDLGANMLPPKFDNRHGYWEHQTVFELHERLLSKAGSAWHEYRPMPAGWQELDEVKGIRGELLAFLREEFRGASLWGVKDPRLTALLPLWLDVLEELEAEPLFVVVVRNPLEVADSLERRDGFSPSKCLLLYMAEMLAALRHTRGGRRAFVSYVRLLEDWRSVVAEIGRRLEIDWPEPPSRCAPEIEKFLSPSERHHRRDAADLRDHPGLPDWCADLHEALEEASRGRDDGLEAAFHRAEVAFESHAALFFPELDVLERERALWELRAVRAEGELTKVQRQLTSILSSPLYRNTRSLRHTWRRLARFRE
ncbi:MAG: sulfotransferase family protein [bacterium]